MDARPYQEDMKQAINKILQQLEKQEKKCFKDLTLAPYCSTCPSLHKGLLDSCLWQRLWKLVFYQQWMKIRPICSAPVQTRSEP